MSNVKWFLLWEEVVEFDIWDLVRLYELDEVWEKDLMCFMKKIVFYSKYVGIFKCGLKEFVVCFKFDVMIDWLGEWFGNYVYLCIVEN